MQNAPREKITENGHILAKTIQLRATGWHRQNFVLESSNTQALNNDFAGPAVNTPQSEAPLGLLIDQSAETPRATSIWGVLFSLLVII